jgi:hypothetical protein
MSLSDLASLGSFVSGLAVLASLVFLFFQMRQMTEQVRQAERNQQAAIRQARSDRTVDIVLRGTDLSFAESMAKARSKSGELSATALEQLTAYWRASFYNWENAFYQHLEGLFTELAFSALALNVRSIMRAVPIRAQWRIQRQAYGIEFVEWMDKLIAETPIRESSDRMGEWQDAMAAERSGTGY